MSWECEEDVMRIVLSLCGPFSSISTIQNIDNFVNVRNNQGTCFLEAQRMECCLGAETSRLTLRGSRWVALRKSSSYSEAQLCMSSALPIRPISNHQSLKVHKDLLFISVRREIREVTCGSTALSIFRPNIISRGLLKEYDLWATTKEWELVESFTYHIATNIKSKLWKYCPQDTRNILVTWGCTLSQHPVIKHPWQACCVLLLLLLKIDVVM